MRWAAIFTVVALGLVGGAASLSAAVGSRSHRSARCIKTSWSAHEVGPHEIVIGPSPAQRSYRWIGPHQHLYVRPGMTVIVYLYEGAGIPASYPSGFPWITPPSLHSRILRELRTCPEVSSAVSASFAYRATRSGTTRITAPLVGRWRQWVNHHPGSHIKPFSARVTVR